MTIYFTSDLHLHHKNIIRHCHRPFEDKYEMDRVLIAKWNNEVKNYDRVYHLGDFCWTYIKNQDKRSYETALRICGEAMRMVHGRTVFLRGNHDGGLQHANYYIWRTIEGMKIFMRHWPPWEQPKDPRFIHSFDIPLDVDLILCGHVHDKWKFHAHNVGQRCIPVINVSSDVWGYKPINLTDIREEVERLINLKSSKS